MVHTGISRCGFNSYGTSQEASWISHGLCLLSAAAKKAGHNVDLIDLRRLKGWQAFKNELRKLNPDVVGFTMMTVDFEIVLKGVKICKEALPKAKIAVGGPHPSIFPNEALEIKEIDYVMQNECEISFLHLLKNLANGLDFPRLFIGIPPDLDELPFADRSLYPAPETPYYKTFKPPFVTLISGRGCIYNCSFCQPTERLMFGRKVRRRSIENVIAELKLLRDNIDFNSFMIHDDCFTEDEDYVMEFCDRYRSEGFQQDFVLQTRADIVCNKTDMIKKLRDAGAKMFSIGFESGNNRILKKILRKGVTAEQNYRAAEICRELGILIDANYMLGIPTETEEEMMDTVRMINAINPEIRSVAFYSPHPGSDLYQYCVENDLLLQKDYAQFRRNPYGEKIKGVDYKVVKKMLWLSRGKFSFSHLKLFISDNPKLYKPLKWSLGFVKGLVGRKNTYG